MNTLESIKIPEGGLVALDFDGTMTLKGVDSEVDLARLYANKSRLWLPSRLHDFSFEEFMREVEEAKDDLWKQYDLFNRLYPDCTDEDMLRCGKRIGEEYNSRNLWDPKVLEIIRKAHKAEAQVIIVTASCQKLVEGILRNAPFQVHAIIGKIFRKRDGFYTTGVRQFPRGEDKLKAIEQHFQRMPDIHLALGDSAQSDSPMIARAKYGFLRAETGLFEPYNKGND